MSNRSKGRPILSYRTDPGLRAFSVIAGVPLCVLVLIPTNGWDRLSDGIVQCIISSVFWAGFTWFPFGSRVVLYTDRLEFVNPWGVDTIPTGIIDELWGRQFLMVRSKDGRKRISWAVQGANLTVSQNRQTRAGRVADELMDAIGRLNAEFDSGGSVKWRPALPPWIFFVGELGLLLLTLYLYA